MKHAMPVQRRWMWVTGLVLASVTTLGLKQAFAEQDTTPSTEPNSPLLNPSDAACNQQAPDEFQVRFDSTAGPFVVDVHRDWAPIGADRFYNLVINGYFDDTTFFRVVPDFVVQFGLNGDPAINAAWKQANIQDEAVQETNKRGRLTFAKSSAPNSRTTQLFINLKDNAFLDDMGFAPFAEVTNGMQNVQRIFAGYGERPDQGRIHAEGDGYLKPHFPNLSRITSATIVEPEAETDVEPSDAG